MSTARDTWTKLIRFQTADGTIHFGEPDADLKTAKVIEASGTGEQILTSHVLPISKLLAPVVPTNIICIGLNYKRHAKETNLPIPTWPVVFYKNTSSLQNPNDPIVVPKIALDPPEVDYEVELAVVIGKPCKNATKENALDYVLGYTVCNDVSARKWQTVRGGSQWCFGKGFDTFCPLGPVLVSPRAIPNPNKLRLGCTLNGQVVQDSNTEDMIFDVPTIIEFLSQGTTLAAGTVILTGTPEGVGFTRNPPIFLKHGDSVTVEIENIGKLTNPVRNE